MDSTKGTVMISVPFVYSTHPLLKDDPEKIIGRPICNQDGKQIGIFTSIDYAKNELRGEVDAGWFAETVKDGISGISIVKEVLSDG